jgi:Ca-activated chloride channel family protein
MIQLFPLLFAVLFMADDGQRNFEGGNYADALTFYTEKQLADPDNLELKFNMANSYYKMQDYTNSETLFNSVIEKGDDRLKGLGHYNLGNVKFKQGDLYAALEHYNQALQINPTDEDAAYNADLVKKLINEQLEKNQQRIDDQKSTKDQLSPEKGEEENQPATEAKEEGKEEGEEGKEEDSGVTDSANQIPEVEAPQEAAYQEEDGELSEKEIEMLLNKAPEGRRRLRDGGKSSRKVQVEKDW